MFWGGTFQRACQAYIWALLILSVHDVYVASKRGK